MRRKRVNVPGLPPGTLTAPTGAIVPDGMHVFRFTADDFEERRITSLDDLPARDGGGVLWVNVDGLGDVALMERLGAHFGLHPLALEDALHVPQRPKVEAYDDHIFFVTRILHLDRDLEAEQISLFLGRDFLITFQEHPGDCLEPIRERLRKGVGQIRRQGADYLMYAIVDAITDHFFPLLEHLGEVVEALEDEVVENPVRATLGRVHDIKRHLLEMRRSVWPLREATNSLLRDESPFVGETARLYLRDCYDHTVQVLEVVETYRELAGGLMDVYLSSVSNKMNEVMKVLTVIATIFIPLTFIAGIYGMNFNPERSPLNMPELNWRWGYPAVWGVMVLVTIGMLIFFRRKGWLGGRGR